MAGLPGKTVALGNPQSSIHQISQVQLADWMTEIEGLTGLSGFAFVRGSAAALSGLGADGNYALVVTTAGERGIYQRASGVWVKVADLPLILSESLAADQAEADRILAQAAADAAVPAAAAAASSQVLADVARTQAQLAAVAAGATIYASVAAGEAATVNGDVFLVSTEPGVQVYENDTGTGSFLGWLGEVLFDDVAALKAWAISLANGTIIRTRTENFSYVADSTLSTTQLIGATTKLRVLSGSLFLNVRAFGAVGDGVTDDYAAIQAAITRAQTDKGAVYLPAGGYRVNTKLAITAPIVFAGEANLIQNVGDRRGAYIIKGADVIGIEVTDSAGSTLRDFAVVGSGTDTTQGIKLTQCGRTKIQRVSVIECGSHGIEYNNGNLTSFRDIYVLGNDGDGILVNGAATPDTNASVFDNIDTRGNGGVGFNIANGWNVFGRGITAQQNTGAGVRLDNSRGCDLDVYAEANATNLDIELTSNANCKGSTIRAVFTDSITDNSNEENTIIKSQNGTEYEPIANIMRFEKVRWPQQPSVTGAMDMFHDRNAIYDWHLSGTGATQTIEMKNIAGIADPAVNYPVQNANLTMHRSYLRITSNDATNSLIDTWGGWSSYTAPSNATRCSMRGDGSNINGSGVYATYSDLRIKENVDYLTDADRAGQVDDIRAMRFARFNLIGDDRRMLGLIAQDVEQVCPGLVAEDDEGIKTLRQSILHQKAVVALQVALERIDALEARLAVLEA